MEVNKLVQLLVKLQKKLVWIVCDVAAAVTCTSASCEVSWFNRVTVDIELSDFNESNFKKYKWRPNKVDFLLETVLKHLKASKTGKRVL